jgi:hypothetical protein
MSVRIHATDLREAAKRAAAIRADALAGGGPVPEVLLDVAVVIERTASAAFETLGSQPAQPECVRYVGTPRGLSGFISDVQRLGIADGVVLLTRDESRVVDLMLDEMATGLGATRHAA